MYYYEWCVFTFLAMFCRFYSLKFQCIRVNALKCCYCILYFNEKIFKMTSQQIFLQRLKYHFFLILIFMKFLIVFWTYKNI